MSSFLPIFWYGTMMHHLKGYFLAITAAACWGLQATLAKVLFQSNLEVSRLVQFRLTIATLILGLILAFFDRRAFKIKRFHIPIWISLGTLGLSLNFFFYFRGIQLLNISTAIFIQYLAPIFVGIGSALFLKKPFTKPLLFAIVGSVIGCFFVVEAFNINFLTIQRDGIWASLAAAITFAWYAVHAEYLGNKYSPVTILFYALLVAAVFWNILFGVDRLWLTPLNLNDWIRILFIAVCGTVLPFWLFFSAMKIIGATRGVITATLEPIFAAFIAWIILNETMSLFQIAGAAIVLLSIVYLQGSTNSESLK